MYYGPRIYSNFNVEKRMDADIPVRLDAIINDPDALDSDKRFMTSLKQYWDKNKYLTMRQFEAISRIESKKGERAEDNEFRKNFSDEQREILNTVARYYITTPYYSELCLKVKADPNFIPSKRQYISMCENKYSISVLENSRIPPKFNNGEIVTVRDTYRYRQVIPGQILMVVEATDIVGPAKGSRVYRIAEMGKLETITLEEKDIKKYRKY